MADKNFKVKSGLQVPSLTTAGPVTTDSSGNVTSSATLPITQGGTGQTSAGNALNALLPLQTSQDNKFLQTNGVTTQWTIPQQQTSTDGTVGYKIYSGTVTPTSPATGDIWIDQTTGNGIQLVRWRDTIPSTTTVLNGLDDNNLNLSYTPGNEQVYINGTLITRGQDYTATNGTSITLTQAAEIGDTVEVFGNPLFSVTDVYTQAQANSLYVSKAGYEAAGKNLCINGGMDIWQRGTSFSNAGGGQYTADRWQIFNGAGSYSVARTTSNIPSNFTYGMQVTATANSSTPYLMQMIETQHTTILQGKQFVVGAWVQAPAGVIMNIHVLSSTVTDASIFDMNGNPTGDRTFTATGSPQFIYSNVGTLSLNMKTLRITIWPTSLSNGQSYTVTGVQLEASSVPTSFSRAGGTIGGELAACQRYYERITGELYTPMGVGQCGSTTGSRISVAFRVTKRIAPSFASSALSTINVWGASFAGIVPTALYPLAGGKDIFILQADVASGLVAGNATQLLASNNASAYIEFVAEL